MPSQPDVRRRCQQVPPGWSPETVAHHRKPSTSQVAQTHRDFHHRRFKGAIELAARRYGQIRPRGSHRRQQAPRTDGWFLTIRSTEQLDAKVAGAAVRRIRDMPEDGRTGRTGRRKEPEFARDSGSRLLTAVPVARNQRDTTDPIARTSNKACRSRPAAEKGPSRFHLPRPRGPGSPPAPEARYDAGPPSSSPRGNRQLPC